MTDEIERDRRVIAAAACPYCAAPRKAPCTLDNGRPRSMPHAERLAAWRATQVPSDVRPLDARDEKVVTTVGCPFCGVRKDDRCVRYPGSPAVISACHRERREACQAARGPAAVTQSPPRLCSCGHGVGQHSGIGCYKCDCKRSKRDVG